MIRLVGSEIFKLRTTRTFYGVTLLPLALVVIIVVVASLTAKFTGDSRDVLLQLMGITGLTQIFTLVLGILAVTSEYRHGTITPSALVVPDRIRLGLGKLGATLLVGLIYGLLSGLLVTLIGLLLVSSRNIPTEATFSHAAKLIVGGAIATALYGAVGVGIGAIIRNQVGAIVGSLIYLFLVENLVGAISGLDKIVPVYGLNGAGTALSGTGTGSTDYLAQVPGGLVLLAWAAVLLAIGLTMMRSRDVTA